MISDVRKSRESVTSRKLKRFLRTKKYSRAKILSLRIPYKYYNPHYSLKNTFINLFYLGKIKNEEGEKYILLSRRINTHIAPIFHRTSYQIQASSSVEYREYLARQPTSEPHSAGRRNPRFRHPGITVSAVVSGHKLAGCALDVCSALRMGKRVFFPHPFRRLYQPSQKEATTHHDRSPRTMARTVAG